MWEGLDFPDTQTVIMKTSVEYLTMVLDHQFSKTWQSKLKSKSRMPEERKKMFVFFLLSQHFAYDHGYNPVVGDSQS